MNFGLYKWGDWKMKWPPTEGKTGGKCEGCSWLDSSVSNKSWLAEIEIVRYTSSKGAGHIGTVIDKIFLLTRICKERNFCFLISENIVINFCTKR